MPKTTPAKRAQQQTDKAQAELLTYDFLPDLPPDVTPEQVAAIIDMVFGYTETESGERNGLSRDQCARLKAKYSKDIARLKGAKSQIMTCLCNTLLYTLIRTGLDAAQHMTPRAVNTPNKLGAVVNAARTLQTLTHEIPNSGDSVPRGAVHNTKRALANLDDLQHVVSDPDPAPPSDPINS